MSTEGYWTDPDGPDEPGPTLHLGDDIPQSKARGLFAGSGPGTCRHCGCTARDGCRDFAVEDTLEWEDDADGLDVARRPHAGCQWADASETLCSICAAIPWPGDDDAAAYARIRRVCEARLDDHLSASLGLCDPTRMVAIDPRRCKRLSDAIARRFGAYPGCPAVVPL